MTTAEILLTFSISFVAFYYLQLLVSTLHRLGTKRLAHYWQVVAGQNLTEWDRRYWRYVYRVVYVLMMVVLLVAM